MGADGSSSEEQFSRQSSSQDSPYGKLARRQVENSSDDDVKVNRLCTIQNRAQRTLDQQVRWIRAIDRKSMRILRFNFVIIGLLLTGFSVVTDFGTAGTTGTDGLQYTSKFLNLYTKYGGLSLLLSTVCAGLTYTASTMQLGIGSGLIEDIQNRKYDEPEYHEKLARYYADWINENDDKLTTNAFLITLTTWLAIYGVVMLVLGVASPLLEFIPKVSFIVVTVSVAALALLSMTDKL